MYSYTGAKVQEKGSRPRWKTLDVSQHSIASLNQEYACVVLLLSHPLYESTLGVDVSQIPSRLTPPTSSLTVTEFLETLRDASLPLLDEIPSLDVVHANFLDANQAGFDIQPVKSTLHHTTPLERHNQTDLRLTHPNVDPKRLFDTSLVTVNGLFHRANYTGSSVDVLHGCSNGRRADRYQVGIYHLGCLGNIKSIPIGEKHIHTAGDSQPLGERAVVEIDEGVGDLESKSVLLVVGGYLHVPDEGVVKRVGERQYAIDFKDYPLAERFFEMDELLDLTYLKQHFEKSSVNSNQVSVETLYSDKTLKKLLQMSQSFFVVVDTPELFLDLETVESNELTGSYISYEEPRYPLVTANGRFREYWAKKENDRYVLSVDDGLRPNYLYHTTSFKDQNSIDPSRTPHRLNEFISAYFWKLGCYV